MRRGFFLPPTPEPEPEPEDDDDASEGSLTSILDVADEEEVEEMPSDFDVGEPCTQLTEVNVDAAHQPQRMLDFLHTYDVQWDHHPFDVFHPEFSIGCTDHESFWQVSTGVHRFAMNCAIQDAVLPDVGGNSLEDLAKEVHEDVPAVTD